MATRTEANSRRAELVQLSPGTVVSTKDGCKMLVKWKDESDPEHPVWRQRAKRLNCGKREAKQRYFDAWKQGVRAELEAIVRSGRVEERKRRKENKTREMRETLVTDFVDDYVTTLENSNAIERSTVRDYKASANRIRRGLDDVALGDLTRDDILRWEADLLAAGLSPQCVIKAHRLLKKALTIAHAQGFIESNPIAQVDPPKRNAGRPNALDLNARTELVTKLEAEGMKPITIAGYIALYGGLRMGEVCALRWQDIELETDQSGKATGGTIWVHAAIGRGVDGLYVKDTKTNRVRDVPMVPALAEILWKWRRKRAEECMRDGIPITSAYVVGDSMGYADVTYMSHQWHDLSKKWGILGTEGRVPTFHDLRHTFATAAISAGVDVKTVSSIMGHASTAMTLDVYASADPIAKRHAANVLSGAMTRPPALIVSLGEGNQRLTGTEG